MVCISESPVFGISQKIKPISAKTTADKIPYNVFSLFFTNNASKNQFLLFIKIFPQSGQILIPLFSLWQFEQTQNIFFSSFSFLIVKEPPLNLAGWKKIQMRVGFCFILFSSSLRQKIIYL